MPTKLDNFTDKSMTYLSKTFSIYENVYLPITGEVNNKKYVFGGKDVISIVDGKVNEYSSISQTGYLYAPRYDDDNKINGFFMFYSTSSSSYNHLYYFLSGVGELPVSQYTFSNPIAYIAFYDNTYHQLFEIMQFSSSIYSIIYNVTSSGASYERHYFQSNVILSYNPLKKLCELKK